MHINERIEALHASIARLYETTVAQGVNIESRLSRIRAPRSYRQMKERTAGLYATAVHDGINIRTLAESIGNLARLAEA